MRIETTQQQQRENDARIGVIITIVSMVFLGYLFVTDSSSKHLGDIGEGYGSRNGTVVVSKAL